MSDPLRQWKLSPMDLPSRPLVRLLPARDNMLDATDTEACALVPRVLRRQESSAAELYFPFAQPDSLQEGAPRGR